MPSIVGTMSLPTRGSSISSLADNATPFTSLDTVDGLGPTARHHYEGSKAGGGDSVAERAVANEVRQFLVLLKNKERYDRDLAAQELRGIRRSAPHSIRMICDIVSREKRRVWSAAITALQDTRDPHTVPALLEALKSPKWRIRLAAVEALLQTTTPDAIEGLCRARYDRATEVRDRAILGLSELKEQSKSSLFITLLKNRELEHARRWAAETLAERKETSSILPFLGVLSDFDFLVRRQATAALAQFRDRSAVPIFVEALRHHKTMSSQAQLAAIKALIEINDATAIPALFDAMRSDEELLRRSAESAIGQFRDLSAVPHLVNALQDRMEGVRHRAAETVIEFGSSAVSSLSAAVKEAPPRAQRLAIWALGEIGEPSIAPQLLSALRNEYVDVRRESASSLAKLKNPVAVPALLWVLENDPEARDAAANALAEIKNGSAAPALVSLLGGTDCRTAELAAWVLRRIGAPAAPSLINAIFDYPEVAPDCASLLVEIGAPAVPVINEALESPESRTTSELIWVLGRMGPAAAGAVPSLLDKLAHRNWRIRLSVAHALGECGDERAIESLRNRVRWPFLGPEIHPKVHRAICDALVSIDARSQNRYPVGRITRSR